MKITINNLEFESSIDDWPEGSIVKDRCDEDTKEFKLTNNALTDESIMIIIDIITKNIYRDVLNPDSIDWENYKMTIVCLGLPFDIIYSLFLHDRVIWFKERDASVDTTNKKETSMYSQMMKNGLINMNTMFRKNMLDFRQQHYDIIDKNIIYNPVAYDAPNKLWLVRNVIKKLSHIPNLFVAGGYALSEYINGLPHRSNFGDTSHTKWNDVDIFAYGPDALKSLLEGVRVCLNLIKHPSLLHKKTNTILNKPLSRGGKDTSSDIIYSPIIHKKGYSTIRTKYAITIPIDHPYHKTLIVQFILMRFSSPYHILSNFDVDSCCIGFEIGERCGTNKNIRINATRASSQSNTSKASVQTNPHKFFWHYKFYASRRFVRAFETTSNVVDPTRLSATYVRRLIKYSNRGFDIAIPGFNKDTVRLNSSILKIMIESGPGQRFDNLRNLMLTGLELLVASSIMRHDLTCPILCDKIYGSVNMWDIYDILINYVYKIYEIYKDKDGKDNDKDFTDFDEELGISEYEKGDLGLYSYLEDNVLKERSSEDLVSSDGKLSFIIGDVLNEGQRRFSFRFSKICKPIPYEPKYPIIELIDSSSFVGIENVSFYEKYYTLPV